MNVAALLGLVELSGTLVLDKNGKIVLLPEGIEARPGDVELSPDNLVPDVGLREALFAQNFGEQNFGEQSGDDSSLSLAFGDEQDAADIIAQIEAGEDPTQNEDQATAAGGELSSSITDAATVEATQVQILAETLFETIGLDRQALSPTQTNTLVDIFINSAPVTIFDARTFDEESTDGELGLTFPSDVDGNSVIVTITELPVLGQITLADGTPVTLGQTLTQQEFESLQFDAPEEYTLGDDAGQFTYSADDGQGQENSVQEGGVLLTINPVNDIPVIDDVGDGTLVEAGNLDDGQVVDGVNTATGTIVARDNDTDSVLTYGVQTDTNEYGQLSVDPQTGEWIFTLDNRSSATQSLKEGESVETEFEITVTDDKGAVVTETLTLTINGTNDLPTFDAGGDAAGTVTEQGDGIGSDNIALGTLSVTDVDDDASLTFQVESAQTEYGSFSIDENGKWQFDLDNDASVTQALADGESKTINYTVSVTDEFGAKSEEVVSITIIGTNDTPEIKDPRGTTGAVSEAGNRDDGTVVPGKDTDTGIIRASDSDGTLSFTTSDTSPYGTFAVEESTGVWRFTLDNTSTESQALKEGQTVEAVFNVKVADETGAFVIQPITIEIFGTNDQPTIASSSELSSTVVESGENVDGTPSASGTLVGEDVDADATLTFYVEDGASDYGQFVLKPNGEWTFELDNNSATTQALNAGDIVDITYQVIVRDEFGAENTETLTITIVGTNDAPSIVGTSFGQVTEDNIDDIDADTNQLTVENTLTVSDVDDGESKFQSEVVGGDGNFTNGELTIDEVGKWVFTILNEDAQVQALGAGEIAKQTFTVKTVDGTEHTITVDIIGTNDVPVLVTGSDDEGTVTEDDTLTTLSDSGKLTIDDVDGADEEVFQTDPTTFTSVSTLTGGENGAVGTLTLSEDGSWTYDIANSAVEYLSVGDSATETFTVLSADGTSFDIVITINGTNDAPVIADSSELAGTVVEAGHSDAGSVVDGTSAISGQLVTSDVDLADGEVLDFSVANDSNPYGSVSIDQSGLWTFELDNDADATQKLEEGETATVTFDVVVTDDKNLSSTKEVTITIQGTNDKPYLTEGSTVVDSVREIGHSESGDQLAEGQINAADYDLADNAALSFAFDSGNTTTSVENAYGTFNINADGSWTFTLDNTKPATQALEAGESVTVDINAYIIDDRDAYISQNLTVTINGTNDAPVIANTSEITGTVVEAGHEDAGDTVAGTPTIDGQIFASDVDLAEGDVLDYSIENDANPYGSVSIDQNGLWTFELDNTSAATQALEEGDSVEVTFDVVVTDDQNVTATQTVTITVEGTNDKPYLTTGGMFTDSVTESGFNEAGDQLAEGQINAADYDLAEGQQLSFAFDSGNTTTSVENDYGTFNINADGSWTFTLDNTKPATQALEAGESVTVDINAYIIDDRDAYISQNLTVTINGTNDAPVIANTSEITSTVVEAGHEDAGDTVAGTPTIDGQIFASDVDLAEGDVLDYSIENDSNPYGTVSIDQNGLWTFELDNGAAATQALEEGESATVTFDVVVTDDQNVTATQTVTITVEGTNDKPYLTTGGIFADSVTESGFNEVGDQLAEGQINAADYDLADNTALSFAFDSSNTTTSVENAYGTFNINADGSWTFTLDNTKPATQALEAGESVTVDINAYIIDDRDAYISQNLTVTINGTNDAPVIANTSEITGTVVEAGHEDAGDTVAGTPIIDGQIFASDVDLAEGDVLDYSIENDANPYGSVSIDQNGLWTFELDNGAAATQALEEGESATVTFDVVVTDDQNVTATQTVTITVEGTNDKPYLT
ncbi:VCBS domain-containing protein, partial [Vibrio maritimus]|uniref:VCBS domain-containing protein n=1 Tax=Vibrio maritimus TaxID=990268 RepID=UPI003735EA98